MVRRRGIVVNHRNRWLAVLAVWSAIAIAGWSHGSVIGRAESTIAIMAIVMMLLFCNECASSDCAELSIMLLVFILVVLSLPKSLLPIARSIVVRWARSVTLLSLLGTTEEDLKHCRNQEEETGNKISLKFEWISIGHLRSDYCDYESHSLQLAGKVFPWSNGGVIDTTTRLGTTSSQDGYSDEGCAEEDV